MAGGAKKLLVVAHPDDESIFFGGLLQREAQLGFRVICVTNGDADGRAAERASEFYEACRRLKVKRADLWGYPDIFEQRLNRKSLIVDLKVVQAEQKFSEVYTHSIIGDYGHPHHQDIASAVAEAFAPTRTKIFHVAYNCLPRKSVALTPAEFRRKLEILTKVYGKETSRFLNILPCTSSEGFATVSHAEVTAIYDYLAGRRNAVPANLAVYRAVSDYLVLLKQRQFQRMF